MAGSEFDAGCPAAICAPRESANLIARASKGVSLSSDKNGKDAQARAGESAAHADSAPIERRFTVGLLRASQLAEMVAKSRVARQVEMADMLAGMYIYEWDRLSKFWDDRESVEGFLRRICSISPQRWHHWIELYDKQKRQEEAELASPWRRLMQRANLATSEKPEDHGGLPYSSELEQIFRSAAEISPFRDDLHGQAIPVLTSECVLLCIARNEESEIARNLRDTGLDVAALERTAHDPRRTPHR